MSKLPPKALSLLGNRTNIAVQPTLVTWCTQPHAHVQSWHGMSLVNFGTVPSKILGGWSSPLVLLYGFSHLAALVAVGTKHRSQNVNT